MLKIKTRKTIKKTKKTKLNLKSMIWH